jgi:hypothetical protein
MRSIDNKDLRKHLKAMRSIRPCCSSKLVQCSDDEAVTMRFLIDWRGRRIRAGLVIGGLIDREPKLSDVGMLCLDQWMRAHPTQTVVFAEFKQVATGNTERLRALLIERLDGMAAQGDNALLLLAAKNSTMYDKIGALIGIGAKPSNARVQAGTTAPQPDPERDEAARRGASPGSPKNRDSLCRKGCCET